MFAVVVVVVAHPNLLCPKFDLTPLGGSPHLGYSQLGYLQLGYSAYVRS